MKRIRRKVSYSTECMSFCNDIGEGYPMSFEGMRKLYSDKKGTTLTANTLVAYPVLEILLNFTASQTHYLIGNDFTIVRLLHLGTVDIFQDVMEKTVGNL